MVGPETQSSNLAFCLLSSDHEWQVLDESLAFELSPTFIDACRWKIDCEG